MGLTRAHCADAALIHRRHWRPRRSSSTIRQRRRRGLAPRRDTMLRAKRSFWWVLAVLPCFDLQLVLNSSSQCHRSCCSLATCGSCRSLSLHAAVWPGTHIWANDAQQYHGCKRSNDHGELLLLICCGTAALRNCLRRWIQTMSGWSWSVMGACTRSWLLPAETDAASISSMWRCHLQLCQHASACVDSQSVACPVILHHLVQLATMQAVIAAASCLCEGGEPGAERAADQF